MLIVYDVQMGQHFLTFVNASLVLLFLFLTRSDQLQQIIRLIQRPAAIPFSSIYIEYISRDRKIGIGRFDIVPLVLLRELVPRDLRHLEEMKT